MRYSNEDFDTISYLATIYTNKDRLEGKTSPSCGYSVENWEKAKSNYKSCIRLRDPNFVCEDKTLSCSDCANIYSSPNTLDCGGECHSDCVKDSKDRSPCDPDYERG